MTEEMTLAWHFASTQMRDGRELAAPGGVETWDGSRIVPCKAGLHASENIIDALRWAPGNLLRRVEVWGDVQRHNNDKIVGRNRRVLWEADMTHALRLFARRCALDVIHLWDAPDVVREYLLTGNESIMATARSSAWAAARSASWSAAGSVERDAAWAAAWSVERDASDAASSASCAAESAASWDCAWSAARDRQEARLVAYANAARCGLFIGTGALKS